MRAYEVNFNESLYLTETGLVDGEGCELEIPNVEDLLTLVAGISEPAAESSPQIQVFAWEKDKHFEIRITVLLSVVWEDVKSLLNTSLSNIDPITVNGTGDNGNFSVSAIPNPDKPFSSGSFTNGRIYKIVLRFITV